MAAPKKQAAQARKKVTVAPEHEIAPTHVAAKSAVAEEGAVMVTANVPKNFNLTIAHGETYHYKAGVQEIPADHADHPYAIANGVTIYDPKAAAKKKQLAAEAEAEAAKREQAILTFSADPELQAQYEGNFEAYYEDQQ